MSATGFVVRAFRRVFLCPRGHAYMWRITRDDEWLECSRCLTVRVLAPTFRRLHG